MRTAIILAGGTGSRLSPLTSYTSKQLLPIYDKPAIFYPISLLQLAGIEHIIIVVNHHHLEQFKSCFRNTKPSASISYVIQDKPEGLPHGIMVALESINFETKEFIVCLGDNFLHGSGIPSMLSTALQSSGCTIFLKKVVNPKDYGIVKFKDNRISKIVEKPKMFISNYAITGLYKFDISFVEKFKNIKKSARNEYEITDILKLYLGENNLHQNKFGVGVSWFDTGTFSNMHEAADFVKTAQNRSGETIGNIS